LLVACDDCQPVDRIAGLRIGHCKLSASWRSFRLCVLIVKEINSMVPKRGRSTTPDVKKVAWHLWLPLCRGDL
jgi:hypothetical protein